MPKRHKSKSGEVRGQIVRSTRKQQEHLKSLGIRIEGFPALSLLIKVKTGSSKHWKYFKYFCARNALAFRPAGERKPPRADRWLDEKGNDVPDPTHEPEGWTEVFEVSGFGPALEELTGLPCVKSWTYVLGVGAPHFHSRLFPKIPNH